MRAITVPAAYKKLVILLGHMFYKGQCPPAWWVDAAEPKKPENPEEAEMALFEEKKASQLAREAKRKAQASAGKSSSSSCCYRCSNRWLAVGAVCKQRKVKVGLVLVAC
jgi:hypothetical protein